MDEIKVKSQEIRRNFLSESKSCQRVYNCNQLFLENIGTGAIIINDTYILNPGKNIYLSNLNNEIDKTAYKFTFGSEGIPVLQGWFKMNEGVTKDMVKQYTLERNAPRPNRMRKDKSYYMDKKRK